MIKLTRIVTFFFIILFFENCGGEDQPQPLNPIEPTDPIIQSKGFWYNGVDLYKTIDDGQNWELITTANLNSSSQNPNDWNFICHKKINNKDLVIAGEYFQPLDQMQEPYISFSLQTSTNDGLGFQQNYTDSSFGTHINNYNIEPLGNHNLKLMENGMYSDIYLRFGTGDFHFIEIDENGNISFSSSYSFPGEFTSFVSSTIFYTAQNIGNTLKIWKTIDFGTNWIEFSTSLTLNTQVIEFTFADEQTGYFLDTDNWLHKTIDGGNNWQKIKQIDLRKIQFIDSNIGYAYLLNDNEIYKTNDGGYNWTKIPSPQTNGLIYPNGYIEQDFFFVKN